MKRVSEVIPALKRVLLVVPTFQSGPLILVLRRFFVAFIFDGACSRTRRPA